MKVEGKPYLFIFDPVALPQEYVDCFKQMSVEAGFPGIYLVANLSDNSIKKEDMLAKGYDAVCYCNILGHGKQNRNPFWHKVKKHLEGIVLRRPTYVYDYRKCYKEFLGEIDKEEEVIPQIVPQWDHSPRGGRKTNILIHSTPEHFAKHVRMAMEAIKGKKEEHQIVMLKSWNEWAEGNYMEPDLTHGRGYIEALRQVLDEYKD